MRSWRPSRESLRACLVAGAACLAYAGTLASRDFIKDDRWLLAENPLLQRGWAAAGPALRTGYVEAAEGRGASVQQYRPVLVLSFLAQTATTGLRQWPLRAGNVLLHAVVCVLVYALLRRKTAPQAAWAGALLFALMPIHTESVSYLTSRSEVLSAALLLAAWLALDADAAPRVGLGTALFAGALLTKEHSALFPPLLALHDWVYAGQPPHSKPRRRIYAALLGVLAGYLALRALVLSRAFHGGPPYFEGRPPWVKLLTLSRFFVERYLWPTVTGAGLCADFTRPAVADAGPGSAAAWACLAALAAAALTCSYLIARRRSKAAFWALGPALFLLPTSHLIMPLDTIGAERFLYLPSLGAAYGLGRLYDRWPAGPLRRLALGALSLWYLGMTLDRNRVWVSELAYYEAALECNPRSARLRSALGVHWLERGDPNRGVRLLEEALSIDPRLAQASYNLARAAFDRGEWRRAEGHVQRALASDPAHPDPWILWGVVLEARGRPREAAERYERALRLMPDSAIARFNLGRVLLAAGEPARARPHLERFVELAPSDPEVPAVAETLRTLRSNSPGRSPPPQ